MAVESKAEAQWRGDLVSGEGNVHPASGAFNEVSLTWRQRAESCATGTSPEELIAAAHAGCFSMALASGLSKAGTPAEQLDTTATVTFQPGEGITGIHLSVVGTVVDIGSETFEELAETAKAGCPVSKALSAVPITLEAALA